MAQCRKCKTNVGCGCNLVNGLCAACAKLEPGYNPNAKKCCNQR